MTKREMLNMVIAGTINDEVIATAKATLEQMDKANSTKNSAVAKKRTEENAPLIAACTTLLTDATEPMLASEIAVALGITTAKATPIAKAVEGVVIGEKRVKGRAVKTYFLEEAEEADE